MNRIEQLKELKECFITAWDNMEPLIFPDNLYELYEKEMKLYNGICAFTDGFNDWLDLRIYILENDKQGE